MRRLEGRAMSCAMPEPELRAQLSTISEDNAWIDDMVAAASR
jgi:hypothetical protein